MDKLSKDQIKEQGRIHCRSQNILASKQGGKRHMIESDFMAGVNYVLDKITRDADIIYWEKFTEKMPDKGIPILYKYSSVENSSIKTRFGIHQVDDDSSFKESVLVANKAEWAYLEDDWWSSNFRSYEANIKQYDSAMANGFGLIAAMKNFGIMVPQGTPGAPTVTPKSSIITQDDVKTWGEELKKAFDKK